MNLLSIGAAFGVLVAIFQWGGSTARSASKALDATLVRLILVPAAMKLMGAWNWWMPSWLDRTLPDLSFEGGGGAEPEPAEA